MEKKNEQVEQETNSLTLSKSDGGMHGSGGPGSQATQAPGPYAGLGAAIAAELMIGFWFGIGVVLAVKTLESLEYCISRKCS